MRLSDLRPEFRRVFRDFDPHTGGIPTDEFDLRFVCPACGSPKVVSIRIGPAADFARRVWQVTPPAPMVSGGWPDVMTISPSINNTTSGHRLAGDCPWHGNITNGEVT